MQFYPQYNIAILEKEDYESKPWVGNHTAPYEQWKEAILAAFHKLTGTKAGKALLQAIQSTLNRVLVEPLWTSKCNASGLPARYIYSGHYIGAIVSLEPHRYKSGSELTNIYVSDVTNHHSSGLRADHADGRPLQDELSSSFTFYRSSPKVIKLMDQLVNESYLFCYNPAQVEAVFNPLAAYFKNWQLANSMSHSALAKPWKASVVLALRAAAFVLLSGCGIAINTNAPKPVAPGSSNGIPVARSGLQLGSVWHSATGNLYPIVGVPGAAHYGGATLAPDPTVLTAAAAATQESSWSLVLHKDGTLDQWSFPSSTVATLAAHIAPDSAIVFSPSGTSAAIASASTASLVLISGLPSKPQIATVAVPAGFARDQIAVSDGGMILVGLARPGSPGVQVGVLSESSGYIAIGTVQAWGGAGFLPGATASGVAIADGSTAQLYFVSNVNTTTPAFVPLATAGILTKPVAVSVSADGKWTYVADSAKPQVVRVSTGASGVAPVSIACACTPQQMEPLTADGVYSLTKDAQGQPAWLLDTRTSQPRTFFVPALQDPAANQASISTTKQTGGSAR